MKHILWILFCFVSAISAESRELTASEFNATYSEENPLILSESVTILLDEDIWIDATQPLFVLPADLQTATIRFISDSAMPKQVQIASQALFAIENQSDGRCIVEFRGNAQFLLLPGSNIWFTNTIFKFLERSSIIPVSGTVPV